VFSLNRGPNIVSEEVTVKLVPAWMPLVLESVLLFVSITWDQDLAGETPDSFAGLPTITVLRKGVSLVELSARAEDVVLTGNETDTVLAVEAAGAIVCSVKPTLGPVRRVEEERPSGGLHKEGNICIGG